MQVKATRQYSSVFTSGIYFSDSVSSHKLFNFSVGEEENPFGRAKELQFECCVRKGSSASGVGFELKLDLDQVYSAESSSPSDAKKYHRIVSYHWWFKVRAVVKDQTEILFDSSGEHEGVITEVWRATQMRRNVHSVGLGSGENNGVDTDSSYFAPHAKPLKLEVELTVEANIIDDQQNLQFNDSRSVLPGFLALQRKEHSDVTIKCESEEIKAHKVILQCYSPVFARMLDSPMDESVTSVIKIDDFEPETILGMINFMYEGSLKTSSKDAIVALLDCAEKYDISELKVAVVKTMLSMISPENAAEFAAAVTKFRGDEDNKQKIFDYCKANFSILSTNSHFRQFYVENVKHFM